MRKFVECLINVYLNAKSKEDTALSWYNVQPFLKYLKLKPKDFKENNFTKSDISRMVDVGLIDLKTIRKDILMSLLLEGKLDFYVVSSKKINRQFTEKELLQIINTKAFNIESRTGMMSEPRHILNKRTLILYQNKLKMSIIEKINSNGEMNKTILSHKKKLREKARRNNDESLELYIECL